MDQEHALEMRGALAALNTDLIKDHPDYVCRVTADEGHVGSAHRARFQDVETQSPVILTTSQLLTTGVDAPTCKNVVLARVVGSMPEFKQIIGRGTRLRTDYGKLAFNIIDYTGTATEKFADPDFDGVPLHEQKDIIDREGKMVEMPQTREPEPDPYLPFPGADEALPAGGIDDDDEGLPRKYYVDDGEVEIVKHLVYELDPEGRKLACRQLTDYTADRVRTLYPNASDLRRDWLDPERRAEIVDRLLEQGIDTETLAEAAGDAGEFYTPRPVVRFMVEVTDPRLGETVLDPACGTGGFLTESFDHLMRQARTETDGATVQERSVFGEEAKTLPYQGVSSASQRARLHELRGDPFC